MDSLTERAHLKKVLLKGACLRFSSYLMDLPFLVEKRRVVVVAGKRRLKSYQSDEGVEESRQSCIRMALKNSRKCLTDF
jgi:hypothetical protein